LQARLDASGSNKWFADTSHIA
jgi:hypothetical protein